MSGQTLQPRVIVFEFKGGARDGQTLRSDRPEDASEARALWALTWNGMVGRRFNVSSYGPGSQRYQVRNTNVDDDEIHLTCEHVDEY
jgi:hypothetical protein